MRRVQGVKLAAVTAAAGLVLVACGDAPAPAGGASSASAAASSATAAPSAQSASPTAASSASSAGSSAAASSGAATGESSAAATTFAQNTEYKACMVSDAGGFDDKSFNQIGAAGLDRAVEEIGVQEVKVESADDTAYAPNIDGLVAQSCNLIVTVGFLLADATKAAAEANPETNFAIIDDGSIDLPNVKPLQFDTAQAAYLAGYMAAGYSKSGTVATFGGAPIPPVTIFMDGFVDGVAKYNEDKGAAVKVLGWDKANPAGGSFTGDFENQSKGQDLAQGFIDQGADVIMPVAGPVGVGAAAAAKAAGSAVIIGVDADWYETVPDFQDIVLTSVLKNMDVAVFNAVGEASADNFSNEAYVGTLENGGVGIAPFHDLDAQVPAELKTEVEALSEQIISGELTVESPSSP